MRGMEGRSFRARVLSDESGQNIWGGHGTGAEQSKNSLMVLGRTAEPVEITVMLAYEERIPLSPERVNLLLIDDRCGSAQQQSCARVPLLGLAGRAENVGQAENVRS